MSAPTEGTRENIFTARNSCAAHCRSSRHRAHDPSWPSEWLTSNGIQRFIYSDGLPVPSMTLLSTSPPEFITCAELHIVTVSLDSFVGQCEVLAGHTMSF
jgi:hypothetical protein